MEKNNPDKVDNLNKSFLDEKSYCHYQLVCTGKYESCLLSKNNLKKSKIPITKQFTKKSETLIDRCQCHLLPKILSSSLILEMAGDYKGNSTNQETQHEINQEIQNENSNENNLDKNNQTTQTEKKNKHFLSALSHQIKTPLNGIVSGLQILQSNQTGTKTTKPTENTETADSSNSDNPEDSILHLMISATNDLSRYVNDIIDYYLLEKGGLQLEYQPINMRLIVSEIKDMFREQLDSNKILFHTSYPDYIPPQEKIDTKRLLQIIHNLMTNSIKDTYKGIISLEIGYYPQLEDESTPEESTNQESNTQKSDHYNLGFPLKNNYLLICISDTGSGIPEKDKASIFEPFFQVSEKWMTQQEGLGLGLTICKKLVEKMNGSIELIQNKYDNKSIYQHFMNSHFKINKGCSLLLAIPLVNDNINEYENENEHENENENNTIHLNQLFGNHSNKSEIDPIPSINNNFDTFGIIKTIEKEDNISTQTNTEIEKQTDNKNIKILIVEDNQINSKLLKMMITKIMETETATTENSDHHEIAVVNNPDEALTTITSGDFDIIFLDLKMPRISGFDILQQLQNLVNKNKLSKMPNICITTALIKEEIEKQLLNYANVSFLYKPIQIDKLKKKIRNILK
jgi:signal transduction histidine kinase/CheY-like chemotaxis protein